MIPAPVSGNVVCGIFRIRLRLVRVFVFLVDEDHTESGNRSEYRRPGTDHDIRLAVPDPAPCIQPFAAGQSRVDHSDPVAEPRAVDRYRLRCQRDFRHETDHTASARQHMIDGGKHDVRFPGAGHTVQ